MNKLWIITIIGAVLFAGWIIWALPSLRKLRRVFPYAFTFALLAAVFVFLLGWFGILGPPSEPIGGTPQDYEIWQARCMAAYGRSMVALLIMTVTYAVATFGILWNSLIEKSK